MNIADHDHVNAEERKTRIPTFDVFTWSLIFLVGYMLADLAARITTVRAGGSWFAFPVF